MYIFTSRISETMLKKAGVPANAKTSEEHAEMASVKLGLLVSLKSETKTPSLGASAGRS